jgi:hypothetical protein
VTRRIKQRRLEQGARIKAPTVEVEPSDDKRCPVFSFEYLQHGYCISDCNAEQKVALADRLWEMSQLSWQQLRGSWRHGQGSEKIGRSSIRVPIPNRITEDVTIIAFRFWGLAPMLGYRDGRIFHVIWIDPGLAVYAH